MGNEWGCWCWLWFCFLRQRRFSSEFRIPSIIFSSRVASNGAGRGTRDFLDFYDLVVSRLWEFALETWKFQGEMGWFLPRAKADACGFSLFAEGSMEFTEELTRDYLQNTSGLTVETISGSDWNKRI